MNEELEPTLKGCPFCGSNLITLSKHIILNAKRLTIACLRCGMMVAHMDNQDYFNDVNVVIPKWNQRA